MRQSIRAKLSVFINYTKRIQTVLSEHILENFPVIELQDRLQRIEDILSEFEDIQSQYFSRQNMLVSVSSPPGNFQPNSSSIVSPVTSDTPGIKL